MRHINLRLNQSPMILQFHSDVPPPGEKFLITIDNDDVVTIDGDNITALE